MPIWEPGILCDMTQQLKILNAEKDGEDGVLVRFSDGMITGYVAEELLALRPIREGVEEPRPQKQRHEPAAH